MNLPSIKIRTFLLFISILLFGQCCLFDTSVQAQTISGTDSITTLFEDSYFNTDNNNDILAIYSNELFSKTLYQSGIYNYNIHGIEHRRNLLFIHDIEWNHPEGSYLNKSHLLLLFYTHKKQGKTGITKENESIYANYYLKRNLISEHQKTQIQYGYHSADNSHYSLWNYQSGLLKHNWHVDFSLLQKNANEGLQAGTFHQQYSALSSIGKQIANKHQLQFNIFYNYSDRAFASTITKEHAALSNNFQYNPNWGYQNGAQRNASTYQNKTPALLLNYDYHIHECAKLKAAFSYQKDEESFGSLDWFHTQNPLPDYYQKLPSFYYQKGDYFHESIGNNLKKSWNERPFQIEWDKLYERNRANALSAINGEEQAALYVLAADKKKHSIFKSSLGYEQNLNPQLTLSAYLFFDQSVVENFRELNDLLGGNYFLNLNQFTFQSYGQEPGWEQYHLLNPNQKIKEGDIYYYHYLSFASRIKNQWTLAFQNSNIYWWLGSHWSNTNYKRKGLFQNGIFENDSYGYSKDKNFISGSIQSGFQYHFSPFHSIGINAHAGNYAPDFEATFINPKIRNTLIPKAVKEQHFATEINWQFQNESIEASVHLFTSQIRNRTQIQTFYHDDYRTNVHLIIDQLNTNQSSIEAAFAYQPTKFLKLNLLAAWQQSFYASRPTLSLLKENDTTPLLKTESIYWQNYYAITGPQTVLGFNLKFISKKWMDIDFSGNWNDRNHAQINPIRHTEQAVKFLNIESPIRQEILNQERLPAYFLFNLKANKSIRIKNFSPKQKRYNYLLLTAGIYNLFNNQGYILYGKEQLRFDFENQNPSAFPNKYRYGLGRSFFINCRLNIN